MTKDDLIVMLAELKAKRNAALRTRDNANIEQRAHVDRIAYNLASVAERLRFNFNIMNDPTVLPVQRQQAATFFENTVAEAELWLTD